MTETVKERYIREAKSRMVKRTGEALAEEFFSVATDFHPHGDTAAIAELMAAAYNMGAHAADRDELPVICANGCPEGYLGRHKFSCPEYRARSHYEHERDSIPNANPDDVNLRLLRAIYGLCPDCNRTDKHAHDTSFPVSEPVMKCHRCWADVDQNRGGTWVHLNGPDTNHYPEPFIPIEEMVEVRDDGDHCPECGAPVREKTLQEGGGVECSRKCGWWFCF